MSQKVSGLSETDYPEVFDIRAMPEQPAEPKPGQLPNVQIKQFFEKGYLIVPEFFKKEELDACRKDIEKLVEDLAQWLYKAGKIKDLHKDKSLFQRLTHLEKEFPGTNVILHKQGKLAQSFQALWSNERLLNVVEQLIGPEIMGHPVWNLRTKTPQNEATTVPWHQDSAYLDNESYSVLQPAAWIPLLDANENNGCMEVVSGGHLTGKIARHTCCWGNTWYVELSEKDIEDSLEVTVAKDKVLCEVPYGGMLLINNLIPHRSLNNLSNDIRWSLDLRWQRPDKPVGFYGLKQGIMMRSKKNPIKEIDWNSFNSVDRHTKADEELKGKEDEDEFDTTIVGPWMKKWEMTHTNRHTARLTDETLASWHKA
ncbi:uncharacterized protein LOC101849867 isoform X4 [Aplysia californica]|uniref:Uncharacterized protein LOC101849867 isoform X4 n=1 Tax=Aplysia californica TaxID=6500 RepID=A0ABM0K021_APLCA|nr:uncharacterized protein LOC101849867 isoform X4 [Aplysia californica]XP_035827525.1 uncharacterized protein LOC101849867 isoform X4 [Aplysia californica]